MCEVEEDPDEMGGGRWRRRQRRGTAVAFLLPLICSLPPAHGHIPVTAGEDVRIEPTPVVVLAGPSSRQVVGFLRLPLEGSGGGPDHRGLARAKREYSLEDFLMWMPSGDGPTEEWQHRPRDTSWMKGDVITTTVFLTTTVYTTIFQPPLTTRPITPPTLTPSTVTSTQILHTKYPGNFDSSVEKPNKIADKGGGKELGEGSGPGSITTSNNVDNDVSQNCNNQTNPLDRPQSDYPQSENSGNQIPDTSRDKDKSTQHKVDKTNYITVTRTITTPQTTLHSNNPPILTTTNSLTQAEYDITDLVQPSLEYPGPSATITASSATPSLSSTLPIGATVGSGPPTGETVINTEPSSSSTYGSVVPTTTVDGGADEGNIEEEQSVHEVLKPKGTTSPTEISSNNEFLTRETLTSPMTTDSGSAATPSGAGGTTHRPGSDTGTDVGVGAPGGKTTAAEETNVSDGTTEGNLNPQHDGVTLTGLHIPVITTEGTIDNAVNEHTETNLRNPATEGATESSGNDPVNEAKTEPSHDVDVKEGTTDASTGIPLGGIGTSLSLPQEETTPVTSLDVDVNEGATITSSSVPVSEGPTKTILDVPADDIRNVTEKHMNVNRTGEPEPTDAPGLDSTHDSPRDIDTTTLSFSTPTDLARSPTTTFPPLFERNTTIEHEIKLFDLTTPASDRNDSVFLGIYTGKESPDGNGTNIGTFSVDFPESNGNGSVFSNVSDTENGRQPQDQDIGGDQGSTQDIYSLPPTVPGSSSSMSPPAIKTESPSLPESEITTGSVEAVDPSPVGLGNGDVDTGYLADNVTVWEDTFDKTSTTDSPILITLWYDDSNISTSISYNSTDDSTSREPFEADFPLGSNDSFPLATDDDGGGYTTADDNTTLMVLLRPTDSGSGSEGSQVDGDGAEVFIIEHGSGDSADDGSVQGGTVSSEEDGDSSDFHPSKPVGSFPTELGNGSTIYSPSKTVTPLSSSGVEASMSVVSLPVKPSQVTTPITVSTSSVMPTVVDPSSYPLENTHSTTTSPTGETEILDTSPYPPSKTYSTTTSPTGETEILDTSPYPPSKTYSTTTLPTGGPEFLDTSPYPPGNTYSTTTSPTGRPEVLSTSGTPLHDSSTSGYVSSIDEDNGGSVNFMSTDATETVYESSSVPSSPEPYTGETIGVSPTLESSQETSTEVPETSPATYTSSLPITEPDVFESPTTEEEEITQTSYTVSETPSSTENDRISTLISIPSTSTTTTPVFITLFTIPQKPEIISTPSTTTLPVVHTSAESTSVSTSTTEESRLTSPVWTIPGTPLSTEQTTGPQPSPPSPSNNATVPLDQRYWVRTVLEGPPKEPNSQLYWNKMEAALTEVYIMAYERDFAKQQKEGERELELNKAPDRELNFAMFGTESPSITTTGDPFENYTTIIARVRRDVMDIKPTEPTRRLLAGQDTRILPARYRTAPALLRKRILIPLHAMTINSEKPARKGYKKAIHMIKPYNVRPHSRRKRSLEWHTKHKSSRESKHLEEPRSLYSKTHVLRKRTVAKDVKVRLHNVTYDNNTDLTELVYTVFDGEEPILASEAVHNMSTVDDMEMAVVLDQVVVVKAEEYLQGPAAAQKSSLVYAVIGGVVGGMMLLVFLIWLSVFLCKRHKRSREELQPDSEAASPRSQLSTNAFTGHVNLAFATNRDEKVEASPLPSTSHALEDHLDQASPTTSHDSLISKPKQGPVLGSSNARSRRHLRHRQEEEEEETAQDDSPEEEEDGHTSEEEVPDGGRPKSSVPWRRPSHRLSRTTTEEPVYSSPNPAHIQYQPSHSTYSKYDTTHSELTSSDARCDPTHQLMANMLQSANSFTNKDQGSVFLPPPLLPPPQGFGKAHESPFIPGTSLPRFLPPPRLPKQVTPPRIPDSFGHGTPSRIQAYDYDPEAPPIPPRNYTREEAGLPPLAQGLTSPLRAQMKDAQVEAHMESDATGSSGSGEPQQRARRPSASSSHLSDSGGSEGSMPNIGRLRRRFHDLLDDAFSLLNGQRPGDKVTPLTTPSPPRKGRSRSAAVQNKSPTQEVLEEDAGGRPWSAAAVHTSPPAWRDSQVVGVVPLDEGRSPRSAWGDAGGRAGPGRTGSGHSGGRPGSGRPGSGRPNSGRSARSITPVNLPPSSPDRPDGGRPSSGYAGGHARLDEPVDPDTGLRASDPAVPLIRAIKDELRRFKSTISTESSSA